MKWHVFGHGIALAYIRLDLGAAAGQRKAEATVQVMRDKTKTWSGMYLATEWLWLIPVPT
ncbi:hypothetical protein GCM10008986_04760 [Salinibacillus aidingensis]|uniref:Uncharacterized protein n=1 Tax=Salinibacillus aidingensis TaxID=237684 RepID=A0ABN1ASG5_9BACI